ncbi:Uncharacterised protein [Citrobacter koseri]|uniref:Uncharacterized protein n=1 Tax=Citrobacter koseri TaxID=545 RepID=A0A2X2VLB7_CITKO|nr:Uncharacterised protein [Citrobacter koseri]
MAGCWLVQYRWISLRQRNQLLFSGTEHLLIRLAQGAEAGYTAYRQAEQTLEELPGEGMSMLTHRLLAGIDYQACEQRRLENYQYLYQRLACINALNLPARPECGPLCYPPTD